MSLEVQDFTSGELRKKKPIGQCINYKITAEYLVSKTIEKQEKLRFFPEGSRENKIPNQEC